MDIVKFITLPSTFGRHQKLQWFYLSMCNILTSLHLVASVFISASVDFRCAIPGLDNDTYAIQDGEHEDLIKQYILVDPKANSYNSCYLIQPGGGNSSNAVRCNSYVYDRSQFAETTTTQFNLVCGNNVLSTTANIIYMAGLFVGSLAFGSVSDFFGRKWTVYVGLVIQGAIALGVMFSPNYIVFTVLRFVLGAVTIGGLIAQFTLMVEICPPDKRTMAAVCQTMVWCTGVMLLSGLAFALRHWRYLQLCIACLSAPFVLLYWWLLEESPSWLLAKGRYDDAVKILNRVKKVNGLDVDIDSLSYGQDEKVEDDETETSCGTTCLSLTRAKTLLWNIIINSFAWFVASMGYYGLALNVGNLVGDLYINNFIGGLVEVPAYILLLGTVRLGRKYFYIALMSIGGVALVVSAFLIVYVTDKGLNWVIITVSMVGKFAVSAGFELVYFWSVEMYPTSQRNSLMGVNSAMARVGSMISPAIADIPKFVTNVAFAKGIAPLIFGVLMIATSITALLLPETVKFPIPETIEEANKFTYNSKGYQPFRHAGSEDLSEDTKEMKALST